MEEIMFGGCFVHNSLIFSVFGDLLRSKKSFLGCGSYNYYFKSNYEKTHIWCGEKHNIWLGILIHTMFYLIMYHVQLLDFFYTDLSKVCQQIVYRLLNCSGLR